MNAIMLYRIQRYLYLRNIPLLPSLIKGLIYILYNSVIPFKTKIGKGSKFAYGGIGVVIHSKAEIGQNVIIGQGITIGMKSDRNEAPIIGDDVYISAGSRILGNIVIGNNVIIGANSVVIDNVPSNSVVAGVPAKVIKNLNTNMHTLMSEKK